MRLAGHTCLGGHAPPQHECHPGTFPVLCAPGDRRRPTLDAQSRSGRPRCGVVVSVRLRRCRCRPRPLVPSPGARLLRDLRTAQLARRGTRPPNPPSRLLPPVSRRGVSAKSLSAHSPPPTGETCSDERYDPTPYGRWRGDRVGTGRRRRRPLPGGHGGHHRASPARVGGHGHRCRRHRQPAPGWRGWRIRRLGGPDPRSRTVGTVPDRGAHLAQRRGCRDRPARRRAPVARRANASVAARAPDSPVRADSRRERVAPGVRHQRGRRHQPGALGGTRDPAQRSPAPPRA